MSHQEDIAPFLAVQIRMAALEAESNTKLARCLVVQWAVVATFVSVLAIGWVQFFI